MNLEFFTGCLKLTGSLRTGRHTEKEGTLQPFSQQAAGGRRVFACTYDAALALPATFASGEESEVDVVALLLKFTSGFVFLFSD